MSEKRFITKAEWIGDLGAEAILAERERIMKLERENHALAVECEALRAERDKYQMLAHRAYQIAYRTRTKIPVRLWECGLLEIEELGKELERRCKR